jgi:hypothetical protein
MIRVQILTEGFVSPNGRAFLFPLLFHAERLAARGIEMRLFTETKNMVGDCDVLVIDSKFYRKDWAQNADKVLSALDSYRSRAERILYFDTTDSSGWLQEKALPFVTRYYKAQLLKDRSRYLKPFYGHRPYTDYYHREFGIEDETPESSAGISDPALLEKLGVSWNSGLADHSRFGPTRMELYSHFPIGLLLTYPMRFGHPSTTPRPNRLSCRMGTDYSKATVAFQRREILRRLGLEGNSGKIRRGAYFAELEKSQAVLSPFGLGEITLKDFEVFLRGPLLIKPDLSHMETWPNLFRPGETMATFRWDLSDLEETIESVLADTEARQRMAAAGQSLYCHYIGREEGFDEFCDRFEQMVSGPLPESDPAG